MLDRLGGAAASILPTHPGGDHTSLAQRMQEVMSGVTGEEQRRPDFGDLVPEIQPIEEEATTKPMPVPVEEIISEMCRRWFFSDFLQAMLLGDPDEKLGVKPEPYAD